MNLEDYLIEDEIINFSHIEIQKLAQKLSQNCNNDEDIVKNCFEYVRDEITHSGDYKMSPTTCIASEVLKYKTGWCYAKSHLLAALLRANKVPTAFCYQRLSCSEYKKGIYCLHGLNAVFLKKYGWYKIDSRGNKEGVDAQYCPPLEKLAFTLGDGEFNIDTLYSKPMNKIVYTLNKYKTYKDMVENIPDI